VQFVDSSICRMWTAFKQAEAFQLRRGRTYSPKPDWRKWTGRMRSQPYENTAYPVNAAAALARCRSRPLIKGPSGRRFRCAGAG
jgi:hypothetical protein